MLQAPASSGDADKIIAGLVRSRVLSEVVAFISSDKQTVFLVASVAAASASSSASAGCSLASVLITEACAAVLAAQPVPPSAPPSSSSSISITSSSPLQAASYVITAKVTGEQQAHATLRAGAAANDAAHVLCQGTLSYAS
jgi:hypothetical protein